MSNKNSPEEVARYFFQSLMQSQCHVCWNLFSNKSQQEFLRWTLQDIYARHNNAAQTAKLGAPEVKIMFETNDAGLMRLFWRRFVQQSQAPHLARYGYFNLLESDRKSASVEVKIVYSGGNEDRINLKMLNERGGWRLAYLESGMPFF